MEISQQFAEAAERVQKLTTRPSNEILLKLYALYKQATEGNVTGERPGGFDFKGAAKYDAWASLKDTPSNQAMKEYIDLVSSLTS
ncbi:MAG: acyl-CoA-binding protein [Cyclobacteriaceae bacterium]|nr:acyl-CoA-binding protein [Cyclobacteriaceae bacterium]